MVLTSNLEVKVPANKEATVAMYAMCAEANDKAPNNNVRFGVGGMCSKELQQLVNFIAKNNFQNEVAQQAIWCITDHNSPYAIYSSDTLLRHQVVKFVCDLRGIPYINDYLKHEASRLFRKVDGVFEYSIQRSATVDLIIYNEAGQVVKDLVANDLQQPGEHKYTYQLYLPINEDSMLKQSLIIKFYLDGRLITEKRHVLTSD